MCSQRLTSSGSAARWLRLWLTVLLPSVKAWEDSKWSRLKPHGRRCHASGILIKDVRAVFTDLLCFFKKYIFFLFKAN